MKKIFLMIMAVIFISGCGDDTQNSENLAYQESIKPYEVGDKIKLKGVLGNEVVIERVQNGFKLENSDKIVMFDIFGTFCEPCKEEAPFLTDFQVKNNDKFMIIAMTYYEDITNEKIISDFVKKYSAYYFISNVNENPDNNRIIEQIVKDLSYNNAIALPFKVVYKNGVLQTLTDVSGENDPNGKKYYLGALKTDILREDFERILSKD